MGRKKKADKGSTKKEKVMIRLLMTGGLPGRIKGDVLEDPTENELERARKSPDCLEIISGSTAPKGGCEEEEVEEDAGNTSKTGRDRKDL